MKKIMLFLMYLGLVINSYSQELFRQDFNSSSTLTSYFGAPITNGKFDAITTSGSSTATINSNALQFVRGSGITSFTRNTNFSPAPTAIIYQFDLTVNGADANSTQAATWQVGNNYSTSKNGLESNSDTYAQMAIDFRSSGSGAFRFNDVSNGDQSSNFSYGTMYSITWVINNSGSTITYISPSGSTETVGNDRVDFWVGTTRVFNDATVESSGDAIQDMKFAFTGSTGTLKMDNFVIQSMNTPQNNSNSFSGNTICNGSVGQLTLTTSAGTGPFIVVYNDGSNRTVSNVVSGVAFNAVVNPTSTTNYALVSITEASGAMRISGFGDSSATITNVSPTATAGSDVATCSSVGAVNVTAGSGATNQASVLWTSNGTGTFSNATSLTGCTYTPSGADISAGSITLTLTAFANLPCTVNDVSTKSLIINSPPTAVAGTALLICSSSGAVNITAGSSATNQASVVWTSNGTGTFANSTSLTNATYNPSAADITAGSRILTLTAVAKSGCSNVLSTKTITITSAPTASAGGALSTCSTSGAVTVTTGSTATHQSSVLWTSSGSGTFADSTSLTACTYTPSAADITAGSVTLTLTAYPNSPCSVNATSNKVLTINTPPTVTAGTAILTCSNSGAVNITAGSAATNQASVSWSSNGTGTFANATSLTTATYSPSAADIAVGSRTLTLTAVAKSGCSSVLSTKTITITSAPTSIAGSDFSTCSNLGAINITAGASGSHYSSVLWSSSGTGSFTAATSLTNCTYAPSAADITAGHVNITLTTIAQAPCSNATSAKVLTINAPPTVTSVSLCQGATGVLVSSPAFSGFVTAGTSISGSWIAGTQVKIPYSFFDNSAFCLFSNVLRNYTATDFQVSVSGTYSLEMDSNSADGMGYLVSGGFTPGSCSTGTWIIGDNNSGAGDEPKLTANLTAGVTYTLISTTNAGSSGSYVGSFSWTVSPPAGGQIMLFTNGTIDWYTAAAGGTAISSGESFNPVGVTGSGLVDTNTAGLTTFYAADSQNAACRTAATFTINTNVTYYLDSDSDGFGTDLISQVSCVGVPVGYVVQGGDCNDGDSAVNPGKTEVCWNGVDDNCDGQLSEGCAPIVVNMLTANNTVLPSFSISVSAYPYAAYPGTNAYRFSIKNNQTGVTQEVDSPTRFVTIPSAMRNYNISYDIKSSAVINGEIVGYAGTTITVFSPVVGLVKLSPASCGVTLPSLSSTISSNAGLNATSYIFRARLSSDNGPTPTYYTVQSSSRFIGMNSFIGLVPQYGATYSIAVQYEFLDLVSSTIVQSGYGQECTVGMPSIPSIGMSTPTCGTTLSSMNATISANPALYALEYEFRIRLTSDSITPTYYTTLPNASRFSTMSSFQGLTLQYGTSYTVSVHYKIMNNGVAVWSTYGAACVLTTPSFPTTEINPAQCGLASTDLNQTINIVAYTGATVTYRITLTEQVGQVVTTLTLVRTVPNFKLNMIAGAAVNKNYTASVALSLNGGDFGPEGKVCDISTFPPAIARTIEVPFTAVAYPNPFANSFLLDVKTSYNTPLTIKVYDLLGRLVEQKQANVNELETTTIGERYPSGVYNVIVTQDDETKTLRVIKR